MKFLSLFVSVFAAIVVAQSPNAITNPTGGSIKAGTSITITWTPSTSGTISLQLRSGSANDLGAGTTIASSIPNSGSYTWTPSTSLPSGSDYTIEIIDDSDTSEVNYSPMFSIQSSGTASSASGSGSSALTSASLSSFSLSSTASGSSSTHTGSSNSTMSTSSKSSSSSSSSSASKTTGSSSSAAAAPSSNAGPHYGRSEGIIAAVVGIGAVVALA